MFQNIQLKITFMLKRHVLKWHISPAFISWLCTLLKKFHSSESELVGCWFLNLKSSQWGLLDVSSKHLVWFECFWWCHLVEAGEWGSCLTESKNESCRQRRVLKAIEVYEARIQRKLSGVRGVLTVLPTWASTDSLLFRTDQGPCGFNLLEMPWFE